MKSKWPMVVVAGLAGLGVLCTLAADPALARSRHHKVRAHCDDRAAEFSWGRLWASPAPRPNGCSPPVFVDGEFIGQDPDPNIRFGLMRDPNTGYKPNNP